jgi:hypothetical protein
LDAIAIKTSYIFSLHVGEIAPQGSSRGPCYLQATVSDEEMFMNDQWFARSEGMARKIKFGNRRGTPPLKLVH